MRADDRIVLSGWSATSESSADLLVGGAVVEGYVAHKSYPENRTDQKVGEFESLRTHQQNMAAELR